MGTHIDQLKQKYNTEKITKNILQDLCEIAGIRWYTPTKKESIDEFGQFIHGSKVVDTGKEKRIFRYPKEAAEFIEEVIQKKEQEKSQTPEGVAKLWTL